jgi:hypothetical protein
VAICAGALVLALVAGRHHEARRSAAGLPAPFAAGDSAGNMTLSGSGAWVLVRWVARSTGTLSALHLRLQADGSRCRQSGKTGYGRGSGGSWLVTTHHVRPDGRPDTGTALARFRLRPCADRPPVADPRQGIVRVPITLRVRRGEELATVIRNTDAVPSENFTSINFLYSARGVLGANGRNERSAGARDALYGLDPRELVGYSADAGRTWSLPGGQYGRAGGRNFLPTYVQEYADGRVAGQPYYYADSPSGEDRTMSFGPAARRWTIRGLGAYTPRAGAGTLTLRVDGRERARAEVSGTGMLRAGIEPVTVPAGRSVSVSSQGLTLQNVAADTAWGRLLGMHTAASRWRIEGGADFSRATPIYPLPGPPEPGAAIPEGP